SSRKHQLSDILDLRAYERERASLRDSVIEVKRRRRVGLGTVVTLMFENRETVKSQIQEMLRAEKVTSDAGVVEELNAYNPLIPEAGQLCATLFVELTTDEQMREWLPKLVGIEGSIVIKLGDGSEVRSITEEGHAETLTRADITAAVHYVRFEFTPAQVEAFATGVVEIICDHPAYREVLELPSFVVTELLSDLQP
ncbi:MAG: DUF3501 family protein, partial [Ilumatobacteraceae bacterium]